MQPRSIDVPILLEASAPSVTPTPVLCLCVRLACARFRLSLVKLKSAEGHRQDRQDRQSPVDRKIQDRGPSRRKNKATNIVGP